TARIILEDEIIAVAIANQIGAANVNVDIPRDIKVHELRPKMHRLPDDLLRDHTLAQAALPVIDVVQEKAPRGGALNQPALEQVPFARGNDAWDEVEGKNPLRSLVVVVNREGNALTEKTGRGQIALPCKIHRAHFLEGREQPAVMRAHHARGGKHFVEKIVDLVLGKKVGHWNIHFVSAPEPRKEKWIGCEPARRCLFAGGGAFW